MAGRDAEIDNAHAAHLCSNYEKSIRRTSISVRIKWVEKEKKEEEEFEKYINAV